MCCQNRFPLALRLAQFAALVSMKMGDLYAAR